MLRNWDLTNVCCKQKFVQIEFIVSGVDCNSFLQTMMGTYVTLTEN